MKTKNFIISWIIIIILLLVFGYIFQTDIINYIYGHLGYFVCCLLNISSNIIALFYYILYATNSIPNLATLFPFLESNKFLLNTLVGPEEEDTAAAGYPPYGREAGRDNELSQKGEIILLAEKESNSIKNSAVGSDSNPDTETLKKVKRGDIVLPPEEEKEYNKNLRGLRETTPFFTSRERVADFDSSTPFGISTTVAEAEIVKKKLAAIKESAKITWDENLERSENFMTVPEAELPAELPTDVNRPEPLTEAEKQKHPWYKKYKEFHDSDLDPTKIMNASDFHLNRENQKDSWFTLLIQRELENKEKDPDNVSDTESLAETELVDNSDDENKQEETQQQDQRSNQTNELKRSNAFDSRESIEKPASKKKK